METGRSDQAADPARKPTEGSPRPLWILVLLLALGVAATLVYKLWPLLHPPLTALAALDPGCDLRAAPCEARFAGGGRVRFWIAPSDIPVATPLQLGVELEGLRVERVEVDFVGVDMYMGFNRVTLRPLHQGRYMGAGMLPVCVSERMTWEARVLIHTPDGLLAAPFRFDTSR